MSHKISLQIISTFGHNLALPLQYLGPVAFFQEKSSNTIIYGRHRGHRHLISPTPHGCPAHSEMRYLRVWLANKSMLSIHNVSIMMWIIISIGNSTGNATEPWILVRTGMHMANEQYQQNSHKWQTWQLGFQTFERYWVFRSLDCFTVRSIFQPGWLLEWRFFLFFSFFGGCGCGWGGGVVLVVVLGRRDAIAIAI